MADPLEELLARVDRGDLPALILVGGNNEYLVDSAFVSLRDRITAAIPSISIEPFPAGADLATVSDAARTFSLFAGPRLIIVPEVHAFVTRKEVEGLWEKAAADWSSAKTDRKRSSAVAKLLHVLGLLGLDVDSRDEEIAEALAVRRPADLSAMLTAARESGKRASRGEGDAAIVAELATKGSAPGTTLLMRTGEVPRESATVAAVERAGVIIVRDLTRDDFVRTLDHAIRHISEEYRVRFDAAAVAALRAKLGIDRILADKFSKDVPDLRAVVAEAERLATFVGEGGTVTSRVVDEQIATVAGGARYELGSLFGERKGGEAVEKLRDLVAQSRRDDPGTPAEIQTGRFLFAIADEARQFLGIHSFCRARAIDLSRAVSYNRFKDTLADPLSEYLRRHGLVRQKPHPFALHRKLESARNFREEELIELLRDLGELDFARKSGGIPAELGLEALILSAGRRK